MSDSYDQTTSAQSTTASSSIYTTYVCYKKGIRKAGIALFLIPFIYLIYTESGLTVPGAWTTSICTLLKDGVGLPMMLGLLRKDEIDGSRALILTRVSTTAQGNNSSKKSQREYLETAAEDANLETIDILEAEESAADIERSQLNDALERGRNGDYDVLMIYEVDRLSRANPWETLSYLNDLREAGITLYADSYGYFDWDEHFDLEILAREAVFARRHLNRIRQGARDGCHQKLKDGQWPFGGNPPVGYRTNEDDELLLDEEYAPFVEDFFEIYAKTENRKETMRQLNDKFEERGLDSISYSRVKTVLQSPLCIGRLAYKGEVVAEMPELRQVDMELFQEVQSILSGQDDRPATPEVPEFAADAVEQYGLEFVMDQFESFKPFRCRKCDGDLERHGSKEVWGIPMAKYRCQDCEYQGPLMTEQELKSLHQTVPVRCPFCTSTESFRSSTRRQLGMQFNYAYECLDCGLSFGSDLSPDRLKRIFSHPNLGFDIEGSDDTDSKDDDDEDDPQPAITDYGNP